MPDGLTTPPGPYRRLDGDDSPQEACGLFGVYAPGDEVARLAYFALFALQHRGQESAGICVARDGRLQCHKAAGLVSQVFDEKSLASMPGDLAIGHNLYSTVGSQVAEQAQPAVMGDNGGEIAVGYNGHIINLTDIEERLRRDGVEIGGHGTGRILAALVAHERRDEPIEDTLTRVMSQLVGAYSLVVLTPLEVVAARDPNGIRPLSIGRLPGGRYCFVSETCALHVIGGRFVREVDPGEIVILDAGGMRSVSGAPIDRHAMCLFEFIYFSRPDSRHYGRSLHRVRQRMGHLLAQEHPVDADLVIGVPDTGIPAAIGYAKASRIPYGEGFIKNRYIQRTFIQPDDRLRELGVRMKLTPMPHTIRGQRLVVVEDSIVRGTTTRSIVHLLRDAGAREVHLRICCPPFRNPCFYGIDTASRAELLAHNRTVHDIEDHLGADSLGFLSLNNLVRAVDVPRQSLCRACFDGKYPIDIPPHVKAAKFGESVSQARHR